MAEKISDLHARMDFYQAWLAIEAPDVAAKYQAFVEQARLEAGRYVKSAWEQPLISTDPEMNLGLGSVYTYEATTKARAACISSMRSHLHIRWM